MKRKFVLLGDSTVGKTSIAYRIIRDVFVITEKPTVGTAFLTKNVDFEGTSYIIQLWDTAGEEKFKSMAPIYVQHASLAFIVFDINNNDSFRNIGSWYRVSQSNEQIPVVFIGNKSDLDNHIMSTEEISDTIQNYYNGAPFFEASALSGTGIKEAFNEAMRIIHEEQKRKDDTTDTAVNLSEMTDSERSGCC